MGTYNRFAKNLLKILNHLWKKRKMSGPLRGGDFFLTHTVYPVSVNYDDDNDRRLCYETGSWSSWAVIARHVCDATCDWHRTQMRVSCIRLCTFKIEPPISLAVMFFYYGNNVKLNGQQTEKSQSSWLFLPSICNTVLLCVFSPVAVN